ncbi:hypothetical protein IWW50_003166 [Coemansia erecta]|nr:hypothetical protein IWW50_003166 [Coemansia erecta]
MPAPALAPTDIDGVPEPSGSIESIEQQLRTQVSEATRVAAMYLRGGDKARALEFHRLRKQAAADAATTASLAANGQALPPILHSPVQWTEAAPQRRDIGAGQLQVHVERIWSEGDLAATLGGTSDFYVQWTLPWPRDRPTRTCTPTLKFRDFEASHGDLHVAHTHAIEMVDRQNTRPLVRWAERAKLTVELYKYMGLLWGSQLIGRATLPLAALRTRAECSKLVEIEAVAGSLSRSGRPLPGGPLFVDVAVRLRLPLSNTPESVKREERWIYIDVQRLAQPPKAVESAPESKDQPVSVAEPKEQLASVSEPKEQLASVFEPNKQPVSEPEPNEQPVSEPEPNKQPDTAESDKQKDAAEPNDQPPETTEKAPKRPEAAKSSQKQPESSNELTMDELEAQLDTMDGIVSNAVLELELKQIPIRIKAASDSDAASHLQDLESAIRLRISVVGALVGAGSLTIQMYMDSVAGEAAQARQWALAAKRAGRKDLAVRALQRMKTMQNEISEMKAAMEAEDE